jgi:hypothetical protein
MQDHIPDGDNRELIAFIPYQLGFYPQESVVLVGVRGTRGEIALIVRTDLADFTDASTSLVVVDTWPVICERREVTAFTSSTSPKLTCKLTERPGPATL